MAKTYNFLHLTRIDEFDALKQSAHIGAKEIYFKKLSDFTEQSGIILKECENIMKSSERSAEVLRPQFEELKNLLAGIGAVGLMWETQNLEKNLATGNIKTYYGAIEKALLNTERLRAKIIRAEKDSAEPKGTKTKEHSDVLKKYVEKPEKLFEEAKTKEGSVAPVKSAVKKQMVRKNDFEKLYILVDNNELTGAEEVVYNMLKHSYTPNIDSVLNEVFTLIKNRDAENAAAKAKILLELAEHAEKEWNKGLPRILVIDDMPDVIRTVKAVFKDKYAVFGATDFAMTTQFMKSSFADLILLDIEMPNVDGFAVLRFMRMIPEYATTPIIFLTSHTSAENVHKAISLGANDFVRKPFDVISLRNKVEAQLALHNK